MPAPDDAGLERWSVACLSLAAAGLFLALAWPLLEGKMYAGDDLDHFHLPLRKLYWQCLHNGDAFDWLPDIFCGFYLTGEGQLGTYHPWHWLLYRWLPFEAAFNLEVFLSYPFMFAGMVGFLRQIGRTWPAALLGAITFTFSGFCLLHFMHINGIAIVAHLPWLLWAIDVLARDDRPRRRLLAWTVISLLTVSQILLGYPQYVWMSFLAELFWVCQAASSGKRLGLLARLAAALIVAALLGAVQLLPTYDHLAHSHRAAMQSVGWNESVAHLLPLHPLNVVQFVAPYLLEHRVVGGNTHECGLYIGAIPLLLAVWLLARRQELGPNKKLVLAVAALGGAALLLALGKYGLIYYVQTWLPVVGSFRVPARYIVLVHFAIAILAAIGFEEWLRGRPSAATDRGIWRLVVLSALVAVPFLSLAWKIINVRPETLGSLHPGTAAAIIAGPILLAVAAVIITKGQGNLWAATGLILFAAADLGYYGCSYVVYRHARPYAEILREGIPRPQDGSRLVSAMPDPSAFVFMGNQYTLGGARLMDGYAGLVPASRLDYRVIAALRVANAGYILRSQYEDPVPGLPRYNQFLLTVPDTLPRFRLVTRAAVSSTPAVDVTRIRVETVALVDAPLELDEGEPGQAELRSERPGELEIETDAPGRQLLVVADRYHSGWQAEVSGETQPVWRVNGDFMGVVVGPGRQTVRLSFHPLSLAYGRMASASGAALLAIVLLIGLIVTRSYGKRVESAT